MENEIKKEKDLSSILNIVIVILLIAGAWIYTTKLNGPETLSHPARLNPQNTISFQNGIELPVRWEDIGAKMIETGVIDQEKFENLYNGRGGLSDSDKKLLTGNKNENLVINSENSGMMLNMLWAFGLANDNPILKNGPMMTYSSTDLPAEARALAGNFASTGGWDLAKGNAMDHYSMHKFVILTAEQQSLVERVAKNIYRPCCDNSTYFPDCNHGMAMLGLLELMASQEVNEQDMYKFALKVNALWFPNEYKEIKTFFAFKNMDWNTTDPKKILSSEFSSASGYQKILSQIKLQPKKDGAGCGA